MRSTINLCDLIDIYRLLHPAAAEHTALAVLSLLYFVYYKLVAMGSHEEMVIVLTIIDDNCFVAWSLIHDGQLQHASNPWYKERECLREIHRSLGLLPSKESWLQFLYIPSCLTPRSGFNLDPHVPSIEELHGQEHQLHVTLCKNSCLLEKFRTRMCYIIILPLYIK